MPAGTPHPPIDAGPVDDDSAALLAVAAHGGALCTVTGITGSWSRRVGAQLAILPDGSTRGSLADGCLESALAAEARGGGRACLLRYGEGSRFVDIRLPCGSGIDIWLDPAPAPAALSDAVAALDARRPASLAVGDAGFTRHYLPSPRLLVLGSGPEATALCALAAAQGIACRLGAPKGEGGDFALALGGVPDVAQIGWPIDAWCAITVLFHDHEWERTLIPWALAAPAFSVGAQGGHAARQDRRDWLARDGVAADTIARLRSPIGLIPAARTPSVLALSILAEIVGGYEALLG